MIRKKLHPATISAQNLLLYDLVFIDTETTGTRDIDVIVEIAIVDKQGPILFNSLINPKRRIPKRATEKHGITNDIVTDAPVWKDVWPTIETLLSNKVICGYNIDFDMRLLQQTVKRAKLNWTLGRAKTACIMKLFAWWYGEKDTYYNDYRWKTLEFAQKFCQLSTGTHHRALDDTLLTLSLLHFISTNNPPKGWLAQTLLWLRNKTQ